MLAEIRRELAHNGTPIDLEWRVPAAGAPVDPVDGVTAWQEQRERIYGFVHQVQPAGASSVRQFNEIEVGDLILDLDPAAAIDGRTDLTFRVNGRAYVPKEIGSKLAMTWDATVAGQPLFRSVLVKAKP